MVCNLFNVGMKGDLMQIEMVKIFPLVAAEIGKFSKKLHKGKLRTSLSSKLMDVPNF